MSSVTNNPRTTWLEYFGLPDDLDEYTLADVAQHTKNDDCWVAVNGKVLNVTPFLDEHPGGREAIMLYAGKDASEEFNMMHTDEYIHKYASVCRKKTGRPPARPREFL